MLSRMHFLQLSLSFSSSFKLFFYKSPLHDFFSNLPTKVYSSPCPPYPPFLLYFFPQCISHSDTEYLFCLLPSLTYKHFRAGFVVVVVFVVSVLFSTFLEYLEWFLARSRCSINTIYWLHKPLSMSVSLTLGPYPTLSGA